MDPLTMALIGSAIASMAGTGLSLWDSNKKSKKAERYAREQAASELAAQQRRESALKEMITQSEIPTEHQHGYKVSLGALARNYGDRRADLDREAVNYPSESGVIDAKRQNLDLEAGRDQAKLYGSSDAQRKVGIVQAKGMLGEYNTAALGDLSRYYAGESASSGQSASSALASLGSVMSNMMMAKQLGAGGTKGSTNLVKPQNGMRQYGIPNGGRYATNFAY